MKKPIVLVCFGLPGCGKSYLAENLSKEFNFDHLSSDVVRRSLFKNPDYSRIEKEAVYTEMMTQTEALLKKGKSVILDATFSYNPERLILTFLASKYAAKLLFIELTASDDLVKERVSQKRAWSDADYEVYLKMKEDFEKWEEDHLIFDSGVMEVKEMISQIKKQIGIDK